MAPPLPPLVQATPWDLLRPADQSFLWDRHPDAVEGAACDLNISGHLDIHTLLQTWVINPQMGT